MISLLSTRLSAFLPAQGWIGQAVTPGEPTIYGIFNVGHGALRYNPQGFYSRLFRTRNALQPGGFQAAWARGSTTTIVNGISA